MPACRRGCQTNLVALALYLSECQFRTLTSRRALVKPPAAARQPGRSRPTVLRCANDTGRPTRRSWRPGDSPRTARPARGTGRAAEPGHGPRRYRDHRGHRGHGDGPPARAAGGGSGPAAVVRPGRDQAPGSRGVGGLLPAAVAAPAAAVGRAGPPGVRDGLAADGARLLAGAAGQPALGAVPA